LPNFFLDNNELLKTLVSYDDRSNSVVATSAETARHIEQLLNCGVKYVLTSADLIFMASILITSPLN